ncbi:HdeD family acid-resistance protein [candidate division KSB3 bacterium]|jgi:uncharacterized membrane protein HdeD (DUF308 family)|uniref:HdeD family acid-resistance protein n=1 Tax=candidate division KSB3 bacterium TaxID=2044937 RepID=A0A9D5JY08_9BACT|nr:HdeD family acid-resistance protein [candidate division KSB3 bacterium]MBD3326046.1 HdeD family acid-resistance protein [candidate division KSB3 bacterium]
MIQLISHYWWIYALRGVLAILFGLAAFFWPGITLTILVLLFGAYVLLEGIFLLIAAFGSRMMSRHSWIALVEGILCIVFSVLAFFWPGITAIALLFLIAFWALLSGIVEILAAIQLRKAMEGEWVLAVTGILSVLVGLVLLVRPGAGALAVIWVIGFYAILFGILLLFLAFKFRGRSGEYPGTMQG